MKHCSWTPNKMRMEGERGEGETLPTHCEVERKKEEEEEKKFNLILSLAAHSNIDR